MQSLSKALSACLRQFRCFCPRPDTTFWLVNLAPELPPRKGTFRTALTVQSVSLAARSLDAVLLVARRPGSAFGVDLCRARLVEVGQIDLAGLRLGSQLVEFLA